jgi:chromosomal replication initiator protein
MTSKGWEKVLAQLKGGVSEQIFETWLRPLRFVAREGATLFIATPHKFFKQWIEDNHIDQIEEAARKELGEEVSIDIVVGGEEEALPPPVTPPQFLQTPEEQPSRNRGAYAALNNRYTFDRFVIGTGNQFAHAACVAVSNSPGSSYNPLFIYGGVGLGKTHLLHAIGNEAMVRHPRIRVCYIPAEKFTNDLIASIRTNRMPEFKERYRNVDILLVDDVQFIAGKTRTQEEFFHTFNDLYSSRKQIVVTSDKFPKEIPDLEERIQSRFEWGLVADIQAPDIETRVAIVNRKAEAENIPHPHRRPCLADEQGDQPRPGEVVPFLPEHGGKGHLPGQHHQGRFGPFRGEALRPALRPQVQADCRAASGRHVHHAGDDPLLLSRHRAPLRRPRPHHRHVRGKKN